MMVCSPFEEQRDLKAGRLLAQYLNIPNRPISCSLLSSVALSAVTFCNESLHVKLSKVFGSGSMRFYFKI
jgi:hypothetical protein